MNIIINLDDVRFSKHGYVANVYWHKHDWKMSHCHILNSWLCPDISTKISEFVLMTDSTTNTACLGFSYVGSNDLVSSLQTQLEMSWCLVQNTECRITAAWFAATELKSVILLTGLV